MAKFCLSEGGYHYATVDADDLDEALQMARDGVDRNNYDGEEGTLFVEVSAWVEDDDSESASDTVILQACEPPCKRGSSHRWESPFELVGGLEENPGVWGHGGGVIICECCMHCGCKKTTDTWGQDPSNGTQGHEVVSYEPGFYELGEMAS